MAARPAPAIVPARLEFNPQGIPLSAAYNDVYHSADGGLEQARHVFIRGNALPGRWQQRRLFTVLETGFGLGLNFLATWQAWRDDPQRCERLHFVSTELHPFRREDLDILHRRWPELAALARQLHDAWPPLTPGFHRLLLDGGRVTLTLLLGDAATQLPTLAARADALYLDGFAPARNPGLWLPMLLRSATRLCATDATLATWSVAINVRETLVREGWALEKRPGFGRKREMLCGRLHSRRPIRASLATATVACRRALVIGAGVAGCAIAERLAARGWAVHLLERHDAPAQEASGNPAGLLHPAISGDDNAMARIVRASHLYAFRLLQTLGAIDPTLAWSPCGILQVARDAAQEAEQRKTCATLGFPDDYVRFVTRAQAEVLAGTRLPAGGWHYPGGAWVSPPTLCRALLRRGGERIVARYRCEVAQLQPTDDGWRALDAAGTALAEAPLAILANAYDVLRLRPDCVLPLTRIRGQVSFLPEDALPDLRLALCGNGYVTPAAAGMHCFGATYDLDDDDPQPRADSHAVNLGHLRALLPEADLSGFVAATLPGRVGFRTAARDRMPLVGSLPDVTAPLRLGAQLSQVSRLSGLHVLTGLGSRGMVFAPLAAELLAAQLEDEPLPLERKLVDALDPARFLLREQRRGGLPAK
ncbi:MAG: bifunctional tRNA (5-methylaminomethyl-2-thiouridine)(34)-methyltransferase MnmD/FAD-dependent 5-carboxymethylaminomethyl-2-thiouridine(34) oxidoreductase MnmC [Rhodocyclaceae bacterium]|nr:bifunctional tRNA (5-methylaminomethyl-2-thiouridine)(34)-methyltransferase MnmD/FAD-dependent 5-carboxymethylaminomethyl-2-thiouridine(34) oxidoreductase MnmC [Rhodocyclaceae bacterium]